MYTVTRHILMSVNNIFCLKSLTSNTLFLTHCSKSKDEKNVHESV